MTTLTITAAQRNTAVNKLNAPAKALYNRIKENGDFPIPNGSGLLTAAQDLKFAGLVIFRWDLFRVLLTPIV